MPVQKRNNELYSMTRGGVRPKRDMGESHTNILLPLYFHKLRGFWPMSSVDDALNVYDLSGQGRTLADNGTVPFNATTAGLYAYADYDGTSDYNSRTDEAGLSITGDITLGAWVWADSVSAATAGIICKWGTAGNRSYRLYLATGVPTFGLTSDGTNETSIAAAAAVGTNEWNFIAARFTDSTDDMDIWVNMALQTNTSGPASIFDSTSALEIGRCNAALTNLNGRVTLAFLTASSVIEGVLWNYFQKTRSLFGV